MKHHGNGLTMETDDDISIYSGTLSSHNLRRRLAGDDLQLAGTNSSRKKVKTDAIDGAGGVRLPNSTKSVSKYLTKLKAKLKSKPYDSITSDRIVHAALTLQMDYCKEKVKKEGVKPSAPKVRENICKLFGISPNTYTKIMKSFFDCNSESYCTGFRGGNPCLETVLPQTKKTVINIRTFVRNRRFQQLRTTATQVLEFCQGEGDLLPLLDANDPEYQKKHQSMLRGVQRWLKRNHYRRGRRSGNIVMKEYIAVKRDKFLIEFFKNRSLPQEHRLREVYLDESYIHQHYKKDVDSLYDPNDEQDLQFGKGKNKGNRYCFVCAIQGPNPRVFEYNEDDNDGNGRLLDKLQLAEIPKEDRGGVVPGSVWCFCPQQKKDHKGDYHKVFKAENFVPWWRDQLLPNLPQPSLIIMDNAGYHCAYPPDVPKGKKKKIDYIMYCNSRNIPLEPTDTVLIIKEKMKQAMLKEKMICEILAEEKGHRVLFQPPCHSDFQPIELLWAKLKGNIGRKYDSNTTMKVLKQRLDEEFVAAMDWNESIEGMIHKTAKICASFYKTIQAEEEEPDNADHSDDFNSDDSDSDEDSNALVAL